MKKSRGRRTSNVRMLSPSEHEAALRLFAVIAQMPSGALREFASGLFDETIGAALARQESEEESP
jgi:hypothetical protein